MFKNFKKLFKKHYVFFGVSFGIVFVAVLLSSFFKFSPIIHHLTDDDFEIEKMTVTTSKARDDLRLARILSIGHFETFNTETSSTQKSLQYEVYVITDNKLNYFSNTRYELEKDRFKINELILIYNSEKSNDGGNIEFKSFGTYSPELYQKVLKQLNNGDFNDIR